MVGPELAAEEASLQRRNTLASGVFWIGLFRWTAQLLSWAIMLVIIRILSPADYGIIGMTTYFIALAGVLAEFGIGNAVLAVPKLTLPTYRQLHTVAVAIGAGALLLVILTAAPISWYFREPVLVPILIVLGVSLLIDGMRTVPVALLNRELEYRKASSVDFVRAVFSSLVVLVMALLGARYWALVGAQLAGSIAATLWAFWLKPLGFERPERTALRTPIATSSHLLVQRLAWQGYQNADFLVVGRLLGAVQLGFYNVGWTIASLPGEKLTTILTAATAPFFASIRHDAAALRRYFQRLTFLLCLVLWPVLFGFVLVADLLIPALLGAQWTPAVPVTRALVLYAALQSPMTLTSQLLMVTGRTKLGMSVSLLALVILPPSFYISGKLWGINGIAWTWAVMYPVINAWPLLAVLRQLGATFGSHLKAVGRAALFVGGMSVTVLLVRWGLRGEVRALVELVASVIAGVAVYGLLLWIGAKEDLRLLVDSFRRWRRDAVGNLADSGGVGGRQR